VASLKPFQAARDLLRKKHGDLLIWGRLHKLAGKTQIELYFVPASETQNGLDGRIFGLGEKLLLDVDFGPEMGTVLAAVATAYALPVLNGSGNYLAKVLLPTASRLSLLVRNLPPSMASADRGKLLYAYGAIKLAIGEQSGESPQLEEAIDAFREALQEYTRESAPLLWAMTQNALGIALRTLGGGRAGLYGWRRPLTPIARRCRNTPASAFPFTGR